MQPNAWTLQDVLDQAEAFLKREADAVAKMSEPEREAYFAETEKQARQMNKLYSGISRHVSQH